MSAALRKRLASLEDAAERRVVERYAQRYGVNVDELCAGVKWMESEYRRLRCSGQSPQQARQQVHVQVAAKYGVTVDDLDAERIRWRGQNPIGSRR